MTVDEIKRAISKLERANRKFGYDQARAMKLKKLKRALEAREKEGA